MSTSIISKLDIDNLAEKYETSSFIKDDPVQFCHRYKNNKYDCEIAGFVSSLLAYGSRKVFIKKLENFFIEIAQDEPYNFVMNFDFGSLRDFNYRFGTVSDFEQIFNILKILYTEDGGLEALFRYGYENYYRANMFIPITDYFYSRVKKAAGSGFYFMIPDPKKGGAMKRMCMYLRWMARKGPVDMGMWNFMPASDLFIPLDVHVGRVSREMGLLERKANDFKSVVELTNNLKKFDINDPVKYDFAMFGYGVNNK